MMSNQLRSFQDHWILNLFVCPSIYPHWTPPPPGTPPWDLSTIIAPSTPCISLHPPIYPCSIPLYWLKTYIINEEKANGRDYQHIFTHWQSITFSHIMFEIFISPNYCITFYSLIQTSSIFNQLNLSIFVFNKLTVMSLMWLHICLVGHLSIYLLIYLLIYLPTYLPIYLSVCLSIYLSKGIQSDFFLDVFV